MQDTASRVRTWRRRSGGRAALNDSTLRGKSLINLGLLYEVTDGWPRRVAFRQAVEIYRDTLGESHPDTPPP